MDTIGSDILIKIHCGEFTCKSQLYAGPHGQTNNENRDDKPLGYANIPRRRWTKRIPSVGISPILYINPRSYKYNSNIFTVCCGLLNVLVCVAWAGVNSVPTGNTYPFVTLADRIPYTNFESKYDNPPPRIFPPHCWTGSNSCYERIFCQRLSKTVLIRRR